MMVSLQDLKSNLDILEVAQRYCEIKRVNNNDYVAVTNPLREEKSSSLHFYVDTQRYYDYGSSEGGDELDFIAKCENISLSDAIKKEKNGTHATATPRPIKKKSQQMPEIKVTSGQLQKEFNNFEKLTMSNPKHKEELLNVFPYWLYEAANKEDLELFLSIARYDKRNNILVAGWYKNSVLDFEMVTYKRRRFNGGKWINRKDTSPNQISFSRVYDEAKPIYILEGMRDALAGILLGLNFIAIATTSFRNYEDINQSIKPTDEVILLCEDQQGYKAMKQIKDNLITKNAKLVSLTTSKDTKMDLSDFVMSCKSRSEVIL